MDHVKLALQSKTILTKVFIAYLILFLARIFTIWMDSADAALLLNFTVNVILSSSIMFAAYFFKPVKIIKTEEKIQ